VREASVGDLLDALHGVGVTLLSDPAGRLLGVRQPVLYDGDVPATRRGLLLLPGVRAEDDATAALIKAAASGGYGAVALKTDDGAAASLAGVADAAGIALMRVDDELEWLHLAQLLGTVLEVAGQRDLSRTDIPIGDLFGLANAIAAATGGATAIEDVQQRVLAYSTVPGQRVDDDRREGILGRQVPDLPENEEQYRELYRATGVVRFGAAPPALPRVAIAVRAGNEPLGSIWLVDAGGNLGGDIDAPLLAAAELAALHLLRARSAEDLARHERGELVAGMLTGHLDAAPTLQRLGVATTGPFVVLAFEPRHGPATAAPTTRLLDLVTLHLDARLGPTAATTVAGTVYAVASGHRVPGADRLVALGRALVSTAASSLRMELVVGVGRPVDDARLIEESRADTDRVIELLRADATRGAVASAEELADQLALSGLATALEADKRLRSSPGQAMLDHDRRHATSYAGVVLTWLDSLQDVGRCAERLSVHPNTVRYRLRRARELFGLDPEDADQLLMLWLTLRTLAAEPKRAKNKVIETCGTRPTEHRRTCDR
jgi:hypothetical protein